MKHQSKLDWMAIWCAKYAAALELKGECGFGRECVGIIKNGVYPAYHWYDDENDYKQLDNNGDIWKPKNAYHKHECVAVLGHGKEAESQLYDWLKWFDDNGFILEHGFNDRGKSYDRLELLINSYIFSRMVKK